VDEGAGGAPVAQRDALKLLAVFLQHTDNKQEQQKLLCLDEKLKGAGAGCVTPFMMIHDVGMTFGQANSFNRDALGSANLEQWAGTPIWRDAKHCVANLSPSQTGTLSHPIISEGGRQLLTDLLGQLTDRQVQDLFEVARFGNRILPGGDGAAPVSGWVDAFKHKRDEKPGTPVGLGIGVRQVRWFGGSRVREVRRENPQIPPNPPNPPNPLNPLNPYFRTGTLSASRCVTMS
jgi:hypothetical protein